MATIDEARRTLSIDMEAIEQQRASTERILRLGVVTLAGAIASIGLLLTAAVTVPPFSVLTMAAAITLNLVATWRTAAILTNGASAGVLASGPPIVSLEHQLDEPGWDLIGFQRSVIHSYSASSSWNQMVIRHLAHASRRALDILAVSAVLYLGAVAYIAAGVMVHAE